MSSVLVGYQVALMQAGESGQIQWSTHQSLPCMSFLPAQFQALTIAEYSVACENFIRQRAQMVEDGHSIALLDRVVSKHLHVIGLTGVANTWGIA